MMYAIIIVSIVLILVAIAIYNNLVCTNYQCDEAWSNVEAEFKRRYVLIPALVSTVKGYVSHEKQLLEELVKLREKAFDNRNSVLSPENEAEFSRNLNRLIVRLEAYPKLKASRNFRELQCELANTEDRIQAALRFYNANVRRINSAIEQFPSNILANLFNFEKRNFFRLEEAARIAPIVRF